MGLPLHFSIHGNPTLCDRQVTNLEMVKFLLSCGAETNIVEGKGKIPMEHAVEKNDKDIINILQKHQK